MTRAEAIAWLAPETSPKLVKEAEENGENPMAYINEAIQLAIEALEQKQQPCDDAISRRAMHIELEKWIIYGEYKYSNATKYLHDRIVRLQPVSPQPKMGRWIDAVIPNGNGSLPVQVCNQCNTFFPLAYTGGGHRFCPNCGTKMESEG